MSGTFRNERPAQERRDILVWPILLVMVAIVLTLGAAAWIAASFPKPAKPSITRSQSLRSVTHYLTADPASDIAQYEKSKQKELTSYGWTDASHTSAHVPIGRAMQMLAEQSSKQEQPQ
jgi:cytoskeletal protein RodZ